MTLLAGRIRLCRSATGAPGKWLYSRAGRGNLPALCVLCPAGSPESEKLIGSVGEVDLLATGQLSGEHLQSPLVALGAGRTVG